MHKLASQITLALLLVPTVALADTPQSEEGVSQDDTYVQAEGEGNDGSRDEARRDRGPRGQRGEGKGQRGKGEKGWYRSAPLLPQEGDFAIGLNAVPFLAYVGNAFNNSTYNSPSNQFVQGDQLLFGKYFLSDDTAIRARARINLYTDVTRAAVVDDDQSAENFDPSETVVDERYTRSTNTTLGGGLEKRRGHGRLQGFYGAEAALGFRKNTSLYVYGNQYSDENPTPTTSTFSGSSYGASSRTLESRPGGTLSLALRGFAGAEFFLAPRVSFGGEFGYSAAISRTGNGESVIETYNLVDEEDETLTFANLGGSSVDLDTDNLSGALYLLVHF